MRLKEILAECHKNYTYVSDTKNYGFERMDTHEEAVLAGQKWSDDCDGFAGTAAVVSKMYGYEPKLIICKLRGGGMHMVCGFDTEETTLIMDCNYKELYSWDSRYEWLYYRENGEWLRCPD